MSDPEIARLREIIAARPRATEIAQMRIDADQRGRDFGIAADVSVQKMDANGVPAEWTVTPDADAASAILYFHGGGYVIGSLDSHRHLAAEVGRASGTRTPGIDYRLAPEHPFPAAGWWWRRCWQSARPGWRCRRAAGASRPGWTWRRRASRSSIAPKPTR